MVARVGVQADRRTLGWEHLQRSGVFPGVRDNEIQSLAQRSSFAVLRRGQCAALDQDLARSFLLVLAGRLLVHALADTGRRLTVDELLPGDVFHAPSLDGSPYAGLSADVAIDDTRVCLMPKRAFFAVSAAHPAVAESLVEGAWRRLPTAWTQAVELASCPVPMRVGRVLLRLAERDPRHTVTETQAEIAERAGVNVQQVNRTIRALCEQELVTHPPYSGEIVVLDVDGLRCRYNFS